MSVYDNYSCYSNGNGASHLTGQSCMMMQWACTACCSGIIRLSTLNRGTAAAFCISQPLHTTADFHFTSIQRAIQIRTIIAQLSHSAATPCGSLSVTSQSCLRRSGTQSRNSEAHSAYCQAVLSPCRCVSGHRSI